jgi:hypothetical protein
MHGIRARHGQTGSITPVTVVPETGQAWNVLAIVNDSIRHAENKAAATMVAAGAIGGAVYSLTVNRLHAGVAFDVTAAICGVAVASAALFAGLCLMPRLRSGDDPDSLLYFHHIARSHQGSAGRAEYERLLKALIADNDLLLKDIGKQIWANSQVAQRKYQLNRLGLIAVLLATVMLAATGIVALAS